MKTKTYTTGTSNTICMCVIKSAKTKINRFYNRIFHKVCIETNLGEKRNLPLCRINTYVLYCNFTYINDVISFYAVSGVLNFECSCEWRLLIRQSVDPLVYHKVHRLIPRTRGRIDSVAEGAVIPRNFTKIKNVQNPS